jgi:hypothetical protein
MSAPHVDLETKREILWLKDECKILRSVVKTLKSNLTKTMVRMGLDATDSLATFQSEDELLETDRDALEAKRDALKLTINYLKSRYTRIQVLGGDCARAITTVPEGSSYRNHMEGFEILKTDQSTEDVATGAGTPMEVE